MRFPSNIRLLGGLVIAFSIGMAAAKAEVLQFNVSLENTITSKTAHKGDKVKARLLNNLYDGKRLIAPAGSVLTGHVTEVDKSRHNLQAEVSPRRWMRASGGVAVEFDRLVPAKGAPIALKAIPVEVLGTKGEGSGKGQDLKVGKGGIVQQSRKKELKPKAARTALGVAAFLGAPLTPIIGGVAGAVRPSTVLGDPADRKAAKHRRLKGMATGFVAGIPGGFLINDAVLKGQDAVLRRGTRFKVQWQK